MLIDAKMGYQFWGESDQHGRLSADNAVIKIRLENTIWGIGWDETGLLGLKSESKIAADESGKYDGVGSGPWPDEGGSCERPYRINGKLPSGCRRQQQDSSEIFSFGSGSGFVAVRVWKCAS